MQDSVQNQIKGLQMKLDELKTEHKCNETSSENVISSLTDKLAEVTDLQISHQTRFSIATKKSVKLYTYIYKI